MHLSEYDYSLPPDLIANSPASPRDHSRLLVLDKKTGTISHHLFHELPNLLCPTDVLVFNQTKVFPARLFGHKITGGRIEILLLKKISTDTWQAISKPGLKVGQTVTFSPTVQAVVESQNQDATAVLQFNELTNEQINCLGSTPIPPYIHSKLPERKLRQLYQTTYAKTVGSAAAPTAGLHFTNPLIKKLEHLGIQTEFVTLHVGLGTFKPLTAENITTGKLHPEHFELSHATAQRLNLAKSQGRRIIAVGTTTTRVLESCSVLPSLAKGRANKVGVGFVVPQSGETNIFIHPPYSFKFVDAMITNFHLPKTSLLMLVSSLVKKPEFIQAAYQTAISEKYRFYSFGDAMLIL